MIRDNFENHFRRNRRFIAKTKNNEMNGGEILFEDKVRFNVVCPGNLKPIEIVPPVGHNRQNTVNNGIEPNNCEVDESDLPTLSENIASSDEYQTAGSSDSEAESVSDHETPELVIVNVIEHTHQCIS